MIGRHADDRKIDYDIPAFGVIIEGQSRRLPEGDLTLKKIDVAMAARAFVGGTLSLLMLALLIISENSLMRVSLPRMERMVNVDTTYPCVAAAVDAC